MRALVHWASCGIALCFAAGCRDDAPFLPLNELCSELVVDVCDARAGCCASEAPDACLQREQLACAEEQRALQTEQHAYDAEAAARLRTASRTRLDACEAAPALASFYQDGLALGAPCARDAQCQSGHCALEARTCSEPAPRVLCASP